MKITTFNPQIITKNPEPIVSLFEELGFSKRHNPVNIGVLNVEGIRMKDEQGFCLDISVPEGLAVAQDIPAIRMNVDDFNAAYDLLLSHGFKNFYGEDTVHTRTSQSAMMISPSGFVINLIEHKKSEQ